MDQDITTAMAAKMLRVSVQTMRRYEKEGLVIPDYRTPGGHRRYFLATIEELKVKAHVLQS